MLITRKLLLWQNCVCHDHTLVARDICLNKPNFGATKDMFCCDKHMFVTNTCLPRQTFCCDKNDTCGSSYQWYSPSKNLGDLIYLGLSSGPFLLSPFPASGCHFLLHLAWLVLFRCWTLVLLTLWNSGLKHKNQQWWRFKIINKPKAKQNKQKSYVTSSGVMDGCLPNFSAIEQAISLKLESLDHLDTQSIPCNTLTIKSKVNRVDILWQKLSW